jgi:hypothetical protein
MRFNVVRLMLAFAFLSTCSAKIMYRRDPLDGALDATLVVIMKQQSLNWFRVEEVFWAISIPANTFRCPTSSLRWRIHLRRSRGWSGSSRFTRTPASWLPPH